MKKLTNLIFRILSHIKNYIKTIALINILATSASSATVSHGSTNDSLPNSIVPSRPFTPTTPTKVAHEIMKIDSVNTQKFSHLDLLVKSLVASKVVNKN